MARRTRWLWPERLNEAKADIVKAYKSGRSAHNIALDYGTRDQYIRELLKSLDEYVYKRPSFARAFRRSLEEKKASLTKRKCLHCSKDFMSTDVGNRICPPCKDLAEFKSSVDELDFPGGRYHGGNR